MRSKRSRGFAGEVFVRTVIAPAVVLIAAVLGIYIGFRSISMREITDRSLQTLRLTQDVFESVYEWLVPSFARLTEDPVVAGGIYGTDLSIVDYADIAQRVQSLASMSALVHSVYLYNPDEGITYSTVHGIERRRSTDPDLLRVIEEAGRSREPLFIPRRLAGPDGPIRVLTFVVYEQTFHRSPSEGCIVVNISEPDLRSAFVEGNSPVNSQLVVTRRDGTVLSHHDPALFGTALATVAPYDRVFVSVRQEIQVDVPGDHGPSRLLAVKRRPLGWVFITTLNEGALLASLTSFRNIVLLILLAAIVVAVVALAIVARQIARPIRRVVEHAQMLSSNPSNASSGRSASGSEIDYVDRVLSGLGEQLSELNEFVHESRVQHEDEAIRALLLRPPLPGERLPVDLPAGLSTAAGVRVDVARLDGYQRLIESADAVTTQSILGAITAATIQALPGRTVTCIPAGDDHVAVIRVLGDGGRLNGGSERDGANQIDARAEYSQVINRIRDRSGTSITIGIGESGRFPDDLHRSYRVALARTDERFREGPGTVIAAGVSDSETQFEFPEGPAKRMVDEILLRHPDQARAYLDEALAVVRTGSYDDFRFSLYALTHLIGQRLSEDPFADPRSVAERLRGAETIPEVRAILSSFIGDLSASYDASRSSQTEDVVIRMREYALANLTDPALSSDMVAEAVDLSVGYARDLFRRITGEPMAEFVLRERLDRVKHGLESSSASVKDLAAKAGFSSYNYFFTAFKRSVGMTPRQYKNSVKRSAG